MMEFVERVLVWGFSVVGIVLCVIGQVRRYGNQDGEDQ
ncbi:hypothetical protein ABIC83_002823 [Roseateles asaccharophilus]